MVTDQAIDRMFTRATKHGLHLGFHPSWQLQPKTLSLGKVINHNLETLAVHQLLTEIRIQDAPCCQTLNSICATDCSCSSQRRSCDDGPRRDWAKSKKTQLSNHIRLTRFVSLLTHAYCIHATKINTT